MMSDETISTIRSGNIVIVTAAPMPIRPELKVRVKAVNENSVVALFGPPRVSR